MGWKATLDATQKIIGKGKIPKGAIDPATIIPLAAKGFAAFDTSRTDLEKKLVELQNVITQAKHIMQQYADLVDGDDFGLDEKNPEDKKRMDAASKLILAYLKDQQSQADIQLDRLTKLDRLLTDLRRFDGLKP